MSIENHVPIVVTKQVATPAQLSDSLQPCTEGSIGVPLASNPEGGDSSLVEESDNSHSIAKSTTEKTKSRPNSSKLSNVQHDQDHACVVLSSTRDAPRWLTHVLSEESDSGLQYRHAVMILLLFLEPNQPNQKNDIMLATRRTMCNSSCNLPTNLYEFTLEFSRACVDLSWYRDTSALYRSETNGMAERAVRRVKEGTASVLVQSGF